MADKKLHTIEYMCTYCGIKSQRGINSGRPMPGVCRRRNGKQPHRWVINRKF